MKPDFSSADSSLATADLAAALETIRSEMAGPDTLRDNLRVFAELLSKAPSELCPPALLYRNDDSKVVWQRLGDSFTFGRAGNCTVSRPGFREVSRLHFEIIREHDVFWLIDPGSFNGTFIRGVLIRRHELRDGDLIYAAGFAFGFVRG